MIKIELMNFSHVFRDKTGKMPTYEEMHVEACRIVLSAADQKQSYASWIQDLIMADENAVQQAQSSRVRSTLESKFRRYRIPGKDNLFDSCPLEAQLQDFVQDRPLLGLTDTELRQEACLIIQRLEDKSYDSDDVVVSWFMSLINTSSGWLDDFRQRYQPSASGQQTTDLSKINAIIHNYSELERMLFEFVEVARAHGIEPDDATLRQKANTLIAECNDTSWRQVAFNNEAWYAKFKRRYLLDNGNVPTGPEASMMSSTSRGITQVNAVARRGGNMLDNSTSDSPGPNLKSSFLLNGDYFHRWIARELARWVEITMSPNNPNQHVPTDEELQHQARWILFDE